MTEFPEQPPAEFMRLFDGIPTTTLTALAVASCRTHPRLTISDFDRDNVGTVLKTGDHWSAHLLRLIAKSDLEHMAAIALVFPSHVQAYQDWYTQQTKEKA